MAGYSDLGAPAATLQWEVYGSADRVSQGGGEEDSRQHRAHVAPCCSGFREDRGSESAQGCRQGDRLPYPGTAAHRVSSAGVYACAVSSSRAAVAPGLGADEATRASDPYSVFRRAVCSSSPPTPIQSKRQRTASAPPSDLEVSGNEEEVEQLERLLHSRAQDPQFVLFRKKAKPKQ